mgnify:CR=1 FL=1
MNKKILFITFLSLIIGTLLVSTPVTCHAAEEIYVDVDHGSDQDGDGSQSNPYKTITKAVGVADSSKDHAKIYLASGVYTSDSGEDFPLTLDNMDLIGNPDDPSQVEVSGEITIENGELRGIHFYQTVTASRDSLIQRNSFSGVDGSAIDISEASIVRDNTFDNNHTAIYTRSQSGPVEIVENELINNDKAMRCIFYDHKALINSNEIKGGVGAYLYPRDNSNLTVKNNDISVDHTGLGFGLESKVNLLIEGNDVSGDIGITGDSSATIDMGGGTLGSSGNNIFQHTDYNIYIFYHELPAYSGTIYAKNNTWKNSSGNQIQPPEVLEGPADTDHFYIKNTGNKIRFSGTEDTTPPSVTIESAPSGTIERRDVNFEWIGSDDRTATSDLVYSYILDGHDTSWSDWTSDTSKSYTDLSEGSYTFKVQAKDEAGNITGTPTTASFTVDLSIPPTLISDFTASNEEGAQSTLTWTNPTDSDLAEVLVRRKAKSYPTDHEDGSEVYREEAPAPGESVSTTDTDLKNQTYYYAAFSKDEEGNWNDTVEEGENADTATPFAVEAIEIDTPGWSMVSIPIMPTQRAPTDVFSSLNTSNMVSRWSPTEEDYLTPQAGYNQVSPLEGMWIYLEDEEVPKEISFLGKQKSEREITLADPGWHQVGPHVSYNWSDVGVKQGEDSDTMTVSEQANGPDAPQWMSKFVFEWDSAEEKYLAYNAAIQEKILMPGEGYWVRTHEENVSLVIPLGPPSSPSAVAQAEEIPAYKLGQDIETPPAPPKSPTDSDLALLDVQASPNPAKSEEVHFTVEGVSLQKVQLSVYDSNGDAIYKSPLVEGNTLTWNLTDDQGDRVSNGIYLYQLQARGEGGATLTSRIGRLLVLG